MSKRAIIGTALVGGGAATIFGVWWANRKSNETAAVVSETVASGGSVKLRLTGYWPFTARTEEKKMEGGVKDRKGRPLHTLEDFFAGKSDHVSLSGDDAIWPYGQKVLLPWTEGRTVVGRVTDTGGHFRGMGKVYRVTGYEPIDVCVESSKTVVPKLITATIVPGDNFEHGKAVATAKLPSQALAGIIEARTPDDYEALARVVESETGGRPRDEQVAAAWVVRNRADASSKTVYDLLAPRSEYGAPKRSGGYASTRRTPSEQACAVAAEVLDAADGTSDPTAGAIDFWMPGEQLKMRALGDVHRAAAASGDTKKAARYERFAGYGTIEDVRAKQRESGLCVTQVIGAIELLRG